MNLRVKSPSDRRYSVFLECNNVQLLTYSSVLIAILSLFYSDIQSCQPCQYSLLHQQPPKPFRHRTPSFSFSQLYRDKWLISKSHLNPPFRIATRQLRPLLQNVGLGSQVGLPAVQPGRSFVWGHQGTWGGFGPNHLAENTAETGGGTSIRASKVARSTGNSRFPTQTGKKLD